MGREVFLRRGYAVRGLVVTRRDTIAAIVWAYVRDKMNELRLVDSPASP